MEGDISNQELNSHEDVKIHKMELSHGDEASSNADQGDNNQQEEKHLTNGVHKELSSRRQDGDPSDSSKSHKRLSSSKHRSSHSSKDGHSGSTSKDSLKVNGHSDSLKSKDKSHHISSKFKEGSSKSGESDKHKDKSRGSLIKSDQEKHKEHHGSTKHEGDKKHTSEKNKKDLNSSKNDGEKRPNGSGDKKSHSNSSSEKKGSDGDKKHSSSNKQGEKTSSGERKSSSGEKKEHKSDKNNKSKETSSFDGKNRDDSYFKGDAKDKQEKHKDATVIDDDYYYKGELSPVKDSNSDKKENKSEKKKNNKETSLISENKLDDSSDFTKQKLKEKKVKSEKQNHKTDKHDKEKTKKESVSPKQSIVKDEPGSEGDYFKNPKDIKNESDSDSDIPLAARKKADVKKESDKRNTADSDSEDEPLSSRKKKKKIKEEYGKKRRRSDSDDSDVPLAKKKNKKQQEVKAKRQKVKQEGSKRKKKEEEPEEVWKWWEEKKYEDGRKWTTLEHKGPVCAPDYEPLPDNVLFYYDGKKLKLSPEAEEVATFYGKMIDHDYTTKESFNKNFFKDWRKVMTHKERELITDLNKCNFKEIDAYFKQKTEERKASTKEEKQEVKKKLDEVTKEYGYCIIDGHKEKIGNFKIEPPGLFRGRGEHPKMGMLKTRIQPEDVIINCTKGFVIPPPPGHKWKEVRHDNTVSWLASWTENVQGNVKYIMLNAASRLKGEKDWQKYEMARKLKNVVASIRAQYTQDWRSKEMRIRQRAVALYFIDKLALRAGNEKDEDQADTVGCCSLRVEHIKLFKEREGKEFVVEFDFLGKDSIRYINSVPVEKRVFKNVELFMENKKPDDDLFDRLNTSILNKYLNELMEGLTAKVFRTYNASITLQEQLVKLTQPDDPVPAKILSYNRANRAVAILCNHQRAAPKTFEKSMENLQNKIQERKDLVKKLQKELKTAKKEKNTKLIEQGEKKLMKAKEQLHKQTLAATDKEENKEIALGTSKLNYLDPRISVAWCKKYDVPLEKIYNKTQREKFRWAIDMTDKDFVF